MEVFCQDWAPNVIKWPHPGRVSQISVCEEHALFLTEDNKVYGTGNNQSGQRGVADIWVEDLGSSFTEIPVPTSDLIVQIETGVKSSFVLTMTGEVYTCGSMHRQSKPQRFMTKMDQSIFSGKRVTQISSGDSVTTFLTEDGAVYIAGLAENPDAKGINASVEGGEEGVPVQIASLWDEGVRVNMISSGANHSIVVGKSIATNETVVYGWGGNRNGELGKSERGDVLRPTLLTNIMTAISENGVVDEVVHVACGRFHSLLTLSSGRVLSVGAQNPYGQMGRSLPTSQYTPGNVPINSCDFMVLDRPVRAAFPGRQFSLLIPQDSTALAPQSTTGSASSLDEFSFGTCGMGGNGCLALYADDITTCSNQPCRLQVRFFSLREAIASASLAPTIPGTSTSKKKKARKSEGSTTNPGLESKNGPGFGPGLGQEVGQGRQSGCGLQRDADIDDVNDVDDIDDDEEDDEEDDELIGLSLDFSDVAMSSESMSSFQSLPKRLISALIEAWSLPVTVLDLSIPQLLSQIEEKIQARVAEIDNTMEAFSTKVMEQLEQHKAPRRLLPPQKKPPRYSLLIANHYNPVDLQHLVNVFSSSSSAMTSTAAAADVEADHHHNLVVQHVCQYMSELCFVSTSLYVETVDIITKLGDLLRSPAHFPNFTTLRLELTSLCDPAIDAAVQEHGDMQPQLEDALFAAWMTSLLHASSRGSTQQASGLKRLEFAMMSQISGKTMRAIADALASHTSPERTVALEILSCNSIGLEADANEVHTAVHDIIALNLPSLHRIHLTDQNTTMNPTVMSLLAPALRKNTYIWQLWLCVSELGAEGVGLLGAQQLCESICGHVSSKDCILFDIDISGDDGQPNIHDSGPAVNGPKLWKQWQTMIRRNSQNYLQFLQKQRQSSPPFHPAMSLLEEPLMRYRQKKQTRRRAQHSSMTYVTARERKWVKHVVKRPLDVSATSWEDEFDCA